MVKDSIHIGLTTGFLKNFPKVNRLVINSPERLRRNRIASVPQQKKAPNDETT